MNVMRSNRHFVLRLREVNLKLWTEWIPHHTSIFILSLFIFYVLLAIVGWNIAIDLGASWWQERFLAQIAFSAVSAAVLLAPLLFIAYKDGAFR